MAGLRIAKIVELALFLIAVGALAGFPASVFGIGGGLFSNLLMTFDGRPIHQAVATSSALAVLISIPGAIGDIYWGLPCSGALSGRRRAADALCNRLCLADRRIAGDADQPADRAARDKGRACDVQTQVGDRICGLISSSSATGLWWRCCNETQMERSEIRGQQE